jgi:putative transposase
LLLQAGLFFCSIYFGRALIRQLRIRPHLVGLCTATPRKLSALGYQLRGFRFNPSRECIQDTIIKFQASNRYKFYKFDKRKEFQKLVMAYNPQIHKRRSIRLKGYDYSRAGLYFITICVQNRKHLFGVVENNEMIMNDAGKMVQVEWEKLTERFQHIKLHEFIVMPNHFHGILEITVGAPLVGVRTVIENKNDFNEQNVNKIKNELDVASNSSIIDETQNGQGQPQGIAPTVLPNKTVGDMMDAFKSITTVAYINGVKNCGWPTFDRKLWQRNYYENIIRDEKAFENISNYIVNNPSKWQADKFFRE